MSAMANSVGNIEGGSCIEKYRERSYLPGEATLLSVVTGMQGGVDGGVYDSPPQEPEWHRAIY